MRCELARTLIGVHDELDAPTRRALQAHVAGCGACADAWLDEGHFRQLVARRAAPPDTSAALEGALLAIPARDLRRLRLGRRVARIGPLAVAAAAIVGGVWMLRAPLPAGPAVDPAALSTPDRPSAPPTGVARLAPRSRPEGASTAAGSAASDPAPAVRPPAPALTAAPVAAAAAGSSSRPAPAPLPAPTSTPAATAAPAGAPTDDGEEDGSEAGSAGPPGGGPPTVTAVPASWTLVVEVGADLAGGEAACPGCDGLVDEADRAAAGNLPLGPVLLEVDRIVDGAREPLFEDWVPADAGVARLALQIDGQSPVEVSFLGAEGALYLCPGEGRTIAAAPPAAPETARTVGFRLWAGCAAPAPSPTPTGTAPAPAGTATPGARRAPPPATGAPPG